METFRWTDYQILLCINTLMTHDKEEALLAEKLTRAYNAHCEANTTMMLATVQTEVKKFWRDRKETRDLMYSGPTKPGLGQNTERNRGRRQRKKDKKKSGSKETVAQMTGDNEKDKEIYCFRCGEISHRVNNALKRGI